MKVLTNEDRLKMVRGIRESVVRLNRMYRLGPIDPLMAALANEIKGQLLGVVCVIRDSTDDADTLEEVNGVADFIVRK